MNKIQDVTVDQNDLARSMLLILLELKGFNSEGDNIMRHHLETGKSALKGIWMIAGCIAVMLLAVVLLSSNDYSNFGFLALLLCPVMHLIMHRSGHGGKHGRKKEAPLEPATQNDGDGQPHSDRRCH